MMKCLNSVFREKRKEKLLKVLISWYTAMSRRAGFGFTYGQLGNFKKKRKKLMHNSLEMAKQRHLLETASKQLIRSCLFDTY